jgi:4-hydroxy-3-methylbut-2-en-1-yl diphosphate reductase
VTGGPFFIAALRSEAIAVRCGAPGAAVFRCGFGGRRAAAAVAEIERQLKGRTPVLVGFSGGLDPQFRPGGIVVATRLIELGGEEAFPLSSAGVADLLTAGGLAVTAAPIATAPRLVVGREAREKAAATGAVAVDLESSHLAPLAPRGLVVVRVIVDVPGKEVRSLSTLPAALRAAVSIARVSRLLWRSGLQLASSIDNRQGDT